MYFFDSNVRYSECDASGRLSIVSMIDYLQDSAVFHSEGVGSGEGVLKPRGLAWFVMSYQIHIDELPIMGTPIRISTSCYGTGGHSAKRDFLIASPEGTPYVRATSQWSLFSSEQGMAIRIPEDVAACFAEEERMLELPRVKTAIRVRDDGTPASRILVGREHLDTNLHVNNAQYVRMAIEALDHEVHPKRIDVRYRVAAQLGDVICPVVHETPEGTVVELKNEDGGIFAIVRLVGSDGE